MAATRAGRPLDLLLHSRLDLLNLLLQPQFALAHIPLGGQVVDAWEARFERIEGVGDQPRPGLLVRCFGQLRIQF